MAKMRRPLRQGSAATPRYRTQVWAAEQADPRAAYEAAQRPGIGAGLGALFEGVQKAGKNLQRQQDEADKEWLQIQEQRIGSAMRDLSRQASDDFINGGSPEDYMAGLVAATLGPLDDLLASDGLSKGQRHSVEQVRKMTAITAPDTAAAQVHADSRERLNKHSKEFTTAAQHPSRVDFSADELQGLLASAALDTLDIVRFLEEQGGESAVEFMEQVNLRLEVAVREWTVAGTTTLKGLVSTAQMVTSGELATALVGLGATPEMAATMESEALQMLKRVMVMKEGPVASGMGDARRVIEMGTGEVGQLALADGKASVGLFPAKMDIGPVAQPLYDWLDIVSDPKNPLVANLTEAGREAMMAELREGIDALEGAVPARNSLVTLLNGSEFSTVTVGDEEVSEETLVRSFLRRAAAGGMEGDFLVNDWMAIRGWLWQHQMKQDGSSMADPFKGPTEGDRVMTIQGRENWGLVVGDRLLRIQEHSPQGLIPHQLAMHLEAEIGQAADNKTLMIPWFRVLNTLIQDVSVDETRSGRAKPPISGTRVGRALTLREEITRGSLFSSETAMGQRLTRFLLELTENITKGSPSLEEQWKIWSSQGVQYGP